MKTLIVRLFEWKTGKTREQLNMSFWFYYFQTRSMWRAYWITWRFG